MGLTLFLVKELEIRFVQGGEPASDDEIVSCSFAKTWILSLKGGFVDQKQWDNASSQLIQSTIKWVRIQISKSKKIKERY